MEGRKLYSKYVLGILCVGVDFIIFTTLQLFDKYIMRFNIVRLFVCYLL